MSPTYFFNEMDFAEAESYINGMRRKLREKKEFTRLVMWSVFQSHSSNELSLDDVMKLDDDSDDASNEVDQDELEELRKRAKQMEKQHE